VNEIQAQTGDRALLDRGGTGVSLIDPSLRKQQFYISFLAFKFNEKP